MRHWRFWRFEYTANELTSTKRVRLPFRAHASSRLRVVTTEFRTAFGKDFSLTPAAKWRTRLTSLQASSQSWRDSKLPVTSLILAPAGRRSMTALNLLRLLDGLTKQTKFRNPRFSRRSKTR